MKKLVLLAALMFVASLSYAQTQAITASAMPAAPQAPGAAASLTLKGDVIDNLCAGTQQPQDLANFVKTHTKACALMANCAAAGYSIFAEDGKLYKFDKASSMKVEEFLKKADSKLQVVVVANQTGAELSLVSIENQK